MRRSRLLLIAGALSWIIGSTLYAAPPQRVPAYLGVIERVQPDGDTLHIYLRGDERQHIAVTLDGWQVAEDADGCLRYVRERRGEATVSRRQARDAEKRSGCEARWLQRHGIRQEIALYKDAEK